MCVCVYAATVGAACACAVAFALLCQARALGGRALSVPLCCRSLGWAGGWPDEIESVLVYKQLRSGFNDTKAGNSQ